MVLIFLLINNYLLVFAGLFDKREQEVESIYQANERISRTKDLKFKNTYDIELLNDEYLANSERINRIINSYGDNNKVVTLVNTLGSEGTGVEIIYALRNNDTLAKSINDNMKNSDIDVEKYYQNI